MSLGPDKVLKVKAVEARNLAAKDSNGLADPYVVLKVQNAKTDKSRFIPATLNPIWNHKWKINTLETLTTALGVGIEVWDHDTLKDDFMGETLITLDRHNGSVQDGILENAEVEGWFPLKARDGKNEKVTGEIFLKIVYRTP